MWLSWFKVFEKRVQKNRWWIVLLLLHKTYVGQIGKHKFNDVRLYGTYSKCKKINYWFSFKITFSTSEHRTVCSINVLKSLQLFQSVKFHCVPVQTFLWWAVTIVKFEIVRKMTIYRNYIYIIDVCIPAATDLSR